MNHTTIGDIVRGDREVFPPYLYEAYQSTRMRAPMLPLIEVPFTLSELTGPGAVISASTPEDAGLTRNAGTGGDAIGQRIIVTGRVLDDHGTPVPNTLLEIWQANAAGRYLHKRDQWPGPIDPDFLGMGRSAPATDRVCAGSGQDRKSTRLNSSHVETSYAVFCLKKKKIRPKTSEHVQ